MQNMILYSTEITHYKINITLVYKTGVSDTYSESADLLEDCPVVHGVYILDPKVRTIEAPRTDISKVVGFAAQIKLHNNDRN